MTAVDRSYVPDGLRWTMTSVVKDGQEERRDQFFFDLSSLAKGYSSHFLMALKTALIRRRNRVGLQTIDTEYRHVKVILGTCLRIGGITAVVDQIDLSFLAALEAQKNKLTKPGLESLKRFFNINRNNESLFARDLRPEDFPLRESTVGNEGEAIKRILSQALTRAAMSQTLTAVEDAYESGELDIGHYSFAMLAFHVFFRPASYRQLRLMDLSRDENKETGAVNWFIDMLPAKTRADNPVRLPMRIVPDVGELLKLQQEYVAYRYGHLVPESEIGKIALFPARLFNADGTLRSPYATKHRGMCANSGAFSKAYLAPIEKLARRELSFNALRHTVGTQLAIAGLSASSIAAVLRHATDDTCQRYVDLFFQGVLDRISDAMQPSFDEHFPVYKEVMDRAISKRQPIPREKAIVSEDQATGRREVTAECGRQSLCGYAPLACYECNKFRPCWDADHTINLDLVNREIFDFEGQGLAMQHEVRKYKQLRNAIRMVISICEIKSRSAAGVAGA